MTPFVPDDDYAGLTVTDVLDHHDRQIERLWRALTTLGLAMCILALATAIAFLLLLTRDDEVRYVPQPADHAEVEA